MIPKYFQESFGPQGNNLADLKRDLNITKHKMLAWLTLHSIDNLKLHLHQFGAWLQ